MKRLHFIACLLATSVAAFGAPNFTGDWKLNAGKSDFGPMPAPSVLNQKIQHDDPALSLSTKQVGERGEMETQSKYSTDGKETTNKMRGNDMKSVAKWSGDKLKITSKADFNGNEITINETWSLSADGKTLTVERKVAAPQGEFESKVVLDKQ
jgi:hypothetical protein